MQQNCGNMTFTEDDKIKALAIVNIFETSRPFGDYAACTVLNDGAGVSYGINQFTHRSGSLRSVVERYLNNGGKIGTGVLTAALPDLKSKTASSISKLSSDSRFKNALRAAAVTREMKDAQQAIAFEKYLQPAIDICAERNFVRPLSLAVVYDSINHGSWERISRNAGSLPACDEKKWILEYVRLRHNWLSSEPRLKPTTYRTEFFIQQIAIGNWALNLPTTVHGFRLTEKDLPRSEPGTVVTGPVNSNDETSTSTLETASAVISPATEKFDRVEKTVTAVTTRADSAKSLWTTVIGTIWQPIWAIFSFLAGLPNEVWIVVAIIAAIFLLAYLYRQIELGKIRELRSSRTLTTDH
jgi:hypothetical protein